MIALHHALTTASSGEDATTYTGRGSDARGQGRDPRPTTGAPTRWHAAQRHGRAAVQARPRCTGAVTAPQRG
jgi:hypothetical protein